MFKKAGTILFLVVGNCKYLDTLVIIIQKVVNIVTQLCYLEYFQSQKCLDTTLSLIFGHNFIVNISKLKIAEYNSIVLSL